MRQTCAFWPVKNTNTGSCSATHSQVFEILPGKKENFFFYEFFGGSWGEFPRRILMNNRLQVCRINPVTTDWFSLPDLYSLCLQRSSFSGCFNYYFLASCFTIAAHWGTNLCAWRRLRVDVVRERPLVVSELVTRPV